MIELAALLRLIPFAIVVVVAVQKGYSRLAYATMLIIAVTIARHFLNATEEPLAVVSSLFSFLLMLHALALPDRWRG